MTRGVEAGFHPEFPTKLDLCPRSVYTPCEHSLAGPDIPGKGCLVRPDVPGNLYSLLQQHLI